ncbi:MAG TPA: DEAD/DEAH box helicase family protein [Capsulimonadaceae bacterium]|jgi:superfamily II DNA or RNA helicase/HKD family nuclease
MFLNPGLYEKLIDNSVKEAVSAIPSDLVQRLPLDQGDSHDILAAHLAPVISEVLRTVGTTDRLELQLDICNRIVKLLSGYANFATLALVETPEQLLSIIERGQSHLARPDTPLARSCILARTSSDPSLESQLQKELLSADRVDILCSFIKWSGIRRIMDQLSTISGDSEKQIRVITTSYMGATDAKAVDYLSKLPTARVRISYDHERTRLHAKAFLFHRKSGFGTAYVGSSNLSHAALTDGLEWNVKISEYETAHVWNKLTASFETYWNEGEFSDYDVTQRPKLDIALRSGSTSSDGSSICVNFDIRPYPFQQEILDRIGFERFVGKHSSHLIVAATGTGKTIVSALDYRNFAGQFKGSRPRLLFVAHREEILRQSLATYRAVLRDWNFGELLVGGAVPSSYDHVFMSIQSFSRSYALNALPPDHYDYIVVDEFHHAAAPSYDALLAHFKPRCLLGLTATPERADDKDILKHFNGHVTAEIRLPDAINRKLLCPFQYFGISDPTDISGVGWQKGGYVTSELSDLFVIDLGAEVRAKVVLNATHQYLLDPLRAAGLGFCVSIDHAEFMAKKFSEAGIPSVALTSRSDTVLRASADQQLRKREINFIFTVDLYNEGVDIEEIDTVLFLRPTESLTVFLQQLGRGLRHSLNKDCLTVLDFVGHAHKNYRFDTRYRALLDDPSRSVVRELAGGFAHLPAGCSITLERVAKDYVLSNIKQNIRRSREHLVSELHDYAEALGTTPTLGEFLDHLHMKPMEIYKRDVSWPAYYWKRAYWSVLMIQMSKLFRKGYAGFSIFLG